MRPKSPASCSSDPFGKSQFKHSTSINVYEYVTSDPINRIDPLGLKGFWWWANCLFQASNCIVAVVGYAQFMALMGELCIGTAGATCILAILGHVLTAGIMVATCKQAIQACGFKKEDDKWVGPDSGKDGKAALVGGLTGTPLPCFGMQCDPFRTGEWDKQSVDLGVDALQ